MKRLSMGLILAVATTAILTQDAAAQRINQRPHLHPAQRAKIDNVIVKSRTMSGQNSGGGSGSNSDGKRKCGQESNGFIVDRRAGGEKVIVALKDVVNIDGDFRVGADCED